MRKMMLGSLAGVLLVGLTTSAVSAQQPIVPEEPSTPARVQVGPFEIRPTMIMRDIGWDSNVFNQSTQEQGDFTATFGAKVDASVRRSRVIGSYSTFYEYLFFKEFESERGSNRGADGRVDVVLGRLRPYVLGGFISSHDRPNAEIDRRARRQQRQAGFGLIAAAFSRTAVTAGFRRQTIDYADDEAFRGVKLADELNGYTDTVSYGADVEVTPLTTLSVHGENLRERFTLSPDRDANSVAGGVSATLNPLAVISGRATVGFRAFRPLNPLERDFTGLTANVAVAYAFHDVSRLEVGLDRNLRHSFFEDTPYYVSTGARVAYTQQLTAVVDGRVLVNLERIVYDPRLDAADLAKQRDHLQMFGGGVGFQLREGARLAINFDHTTRSSPAADREFSRDRLYATVTYGF